MVLEVCLWSFRNTDSYFRSPEGVSERGKGWQRCRFNSSAAELLTNIKKNPGWVCIAVFLSTGVTRSLRVLIKTNVLRKILMKTNKKVPLHYLKVTESYQYIAGNMQTQVYASLILYLHCHRRFANYVPLSYFFPSQRETCTLSGKTLFLSFHCNTVPFL